MPGPRQPTELLVLNGNKHLSRSEEDERRDAEVHVPPAETVMPPDYLPKKLHDEFIRTGELLCASGLYTDLDQDVLAQFYLCRDRWIRADKQAAKAINAKDEKLAKEWTAIQGQYFRQCRQCAEVMGLSVSSRCRLVVPTALVNAAADTGEEDDFSRKLAARQRRASGG